MSNLERDLTRINEGKMAQLILSWLDPILEQVKREAEGKFIGQFKEGKLDSGNSLAYAATLGTIEDVRNKLLAKIRSSERVTTNARDSHNDHDSSAQS